jgi:hypothetical protein
MACCVLLLNGVVPVFRSFIKVTSKSASGWEIEFFGAHQRTEVSI